MATKKPKNSASLAQQPHWNALTLSLIASAVVLGGYLIIKFIHASATTMYLSPPSANVVQNTTVAVAVRVNTGGESVNAVQANLTYPADKFDFISINDAGSAFGTVAESQGGSGSVRIARATQGGSAPIVGDALITTVNLRAKVNVGSGVVVFGAGSAVARSNGDGVNILSGTTGGTYTFQAAAVAPPPTPPTAPTPQPAPSPTARPAPTPVPVTKAPTPVPPPVTVTKTPTPAAAPPVPTQATNPPTVAPSHVNVPLTGQSHLSYPVPIPLTPQSHIAGYVKPLAIGGTVLLLLVLAVMGIIWAQRSSTMHHEVAASTATSAGPTNNVPQAANITAPASPSNNVSPDGPPPPTTIYPANFQPTDTPAAPPPSGPQDGNNLTL